MVIKVPVVLTYSNKGTKQASKDLNLLGKSIKKFGLASKLSIAGITASVSLLAKQSVSAAIAEEKQAKSLSLTLKNLGKSYAAVGVAEYVNKLQFATGVSEDQLRPALQRLITTTNDVAKSQDLLKLALDISAGSTNSLETVVKALGRAYLGNNTALGRLGLNLTKAELKVATFEQITAKLAATYQGQATEAAKTFGGQLAILGVAADEAKEKIGVSLINAIQELAGDQGVAGVADDMDRLATKTANAITGFTFLIDKVKALGNVALENGLLPKTPKNSTFFGINPNQPFFGILADIGAQQNALSNAGTTPKASALGEQRKAIAAGKVAVDLNKKAAAAKKAELAAQRALATSKKLAAKFDQENIAIEAALKAKLSDEDRARLLAMKALKTETTADDAKALADLNTAVKKNAAEELAGIKAAEEANTQAIAKRKSEYQALQEWLASNPLKVFTTAIINGTEVTAPAAFGLSGTNAAPSVPTTNASTGVNTGSMASVAAVAGGAGNITVNVNAGTIADENKLTYIISNELTKFVRFGGITAPAGFI
jgi:hypothetical protein